jgi:hypothetical protein
MESNNKSEEVKLKIANDYDFINSKKHRYSLQRFLKQSPDGTTDNIIAYFLCIQPNDVRTLYGSAVEKIRQKLKIKVD